MEATESAESLAHSIKLEVKSLVDVTPEDVQNFDKFVDTESDRYLKGIKSPLREELGTAAFVHAHAFKSLKELIRNSHDFNLILAKDQNGHIAGYSLVSLDPKNKDPFDQVKHVFLGVGWENRKRGLGTELLKKRIAVLKEKGIKGYTSDTRNEVLSLYDRLGVPYTSEPLPKTANNANMAQKLTVQIK